MKEIIDDEMPTHFKCQNCGYTGPVNELMDEDQMLYCPICDSPDFLFKD